MSETDTLGIHDVESCLVQSLSYYMALDDNDLRLIEALEKEQTHFARGDVIQPCRTARSSLYAVTSGWLYASLTDADGRRQITRVFHPGDVVGLSDLSLGLSSCDLVAAGDVVVCPFPRQGLAPILETAPRLSALLFALSARDQAIHMDLIRAIGCLSAVERVGFMLLTWLMRLRMTGDPVETTIRCPMTQTEMGDLIGLTNVSVSKALSTLESEGYLKRDANTLTLLEVDELIAVTRFEDRYGELDTTWFPES